MNLAKLQGSRLAYKNQLCFYIPAMNNLEVNSIYNINSIYSISQKNMTHRNKLNQGGENYKTLFKEIKDILCL